MANPAKAQLTSGQGAAAIIAGVIGHFLFSIAWAGLLISIVFLVARSFINGLIEQFLTSSVLEGDAGTTIKQVLEGVQGFLSGLSIVFIVLNALGIIFAFFISWLILKIGKVRKPGGATFSSFLIVALIDGGLLFLSLAIASSIAKNTDGSPFLIVWVVVTAVIGALVWLWMVWVRRGPAPEAAAGAPAVATAADAPVLDAGAKPAAEAPVVDPAAPAAAAVAAPVKKPAAKKPAAKKAPATKPPAGTDAS